MSKVILILALLAACSNDGPRPPIEAEPMLKGSCVDRVGPNLFGPGDVAYRECRWRERVWVCMLEIDGYRAVQTWRCAAVTRAPSEATRTAPEAPAAPGPAGPTS